MGYSFLEKENLPEALKDKPKWVSCLAIASALLVITLSAVTIGAIFGYTYCYIEHRGIKQGNHTQSTNFQLGLPYPDSEEAQYNRTINGALMSSVFVSRIMKIGHALLDDTVGCNPIDDNSNDTVTKTI